MSFLLDTCVLSESTKSSPDPNVVHWLAQTPENLKYISIVSLAEIKFGILCLPAGLKRSKLEIWYADILRPSAADRIVMFDESIALKWAALRAARRDAPVLDVQIAASALAHGFTLVTRNTRDFAFPGLAVFNPWSK